MIEWVEYMDECQSLRLASGEDVIVHCGDLLKLYHAPEGIKLLEVLKPTRH